MTLVVTGATGHLGRLVVDQLLAHGASPSDLVAAGRNRERLAALADLGVRTAAIDFDDPASLDAAFAGADKVLLVSGQQLGHRVAQHAAALAAVQRAGASIVYTSAPRVDVSELVVAPDHRATEELIVASGVSFTFLRNNWYTENYADTVRQAAATGVILSSAGDGRVASAPRSDYAEAAALVLLGSEYDGAVLELGGDEPWTFAELAATVAEVAGRPVEVNRVTAAEQVAALEAVGLDADTAGFVAALDGNIRDGWLAGTDHTLSRILGRPTVPLADSVRAFLAV